MRDLLQKLAEIGGPRAKVIAYLGVIGLMSLVLVIDALVRNVRAEWTAALLALLAAVALAGGEAVTK